MATLTVATVSRAGTDIAGTSAAGGGDVFANDGYTFLKVTNGGGSSINVTIDCTQTLDGMAVTDPVVAVAAGATKLIGPFSPSLFNDANGRVGVGYSAVTSVTVAALKCPPA